MSQPTTDVHIAAYSELPTPRQLIEELPRNAGQEAFITQSRQEIQRIIFGDDPRLLCIVGPCSIHDVEAGREYAKRLAALAEEVKDRLYLVMRVYFEKPRTTVGWKGLIMDPHLDNTADIPEGLRSARRFLADVIDLGIPTATELLDPITPQYIAGLVCWSAIGARTTESQTHRQMASGLSMPLGFKNNTDGNIEVAINAIRAASAPQSFLGIDKDGRAAAVTTKGNKDCHVILRGGRHSPNFDVKSIRETDKLLQAASLPRAVMIDCSHANSNKDPNLQPEVLGYILGLIRKGEQSIIGVMVESNLEGGNQKFPQPKNDLKHGVSITDGCIGWDETVTLIRDTYDALGSRF